MGTESTFTFTDDGGAEVFVRRWMPEGDPKAMLQIAHGAVEHSARYGRLATALNEAGYGVVAPDHRAHGQSAGSLETAGDVGGDGWDQIVGGFSKLTDMILEQHPGVPLFVLGHSMGSIVAQDIAERRGGDFAGVVLMGSWGTMGDTAPLLAALDAEAAEGGPKAPSMVFAQLFVAFNEPFGTGDGDTGFEWLSRDGAEVQAYVDDEWSGSYAYTTEYVKSFVEGMERVWLPENEAKIPATLPILVTSGLADPAGGMGETTQVLIDRYRDGGLAVEAQLYPDARHEILNETNRDEVTANLISWFDAHC